MQTRESEAREKDQRTQKPEATQEPPTEKKYAYTVQGETPTRSRTNPEKQEKLWSEPHTPGQREP